MQGVTKAYVFVAFSCIPVHALRASALPNGAEAEASGVQQRQQPALKIIVDERNTKVFPPPQAFGSAAVAAQIAQLIGPPSSCPPGVGNSIPSDQPVAQDHAGSLQQLQGGGQDANQPSHIPVVTPRERSTDDWDIQNVLADFLHGSGGGSTSADVAQICPHQLDKAPVVSETDDFANAFLDPVLGLGDNDILGAFGSDDAVETGNFRHFDQSLRHDFTKSPGSFGWRNKIAPK